jgi:hypothetical protein
VTSVDVELAEKEARRPRCILDMYHPECGLFCKILLPVESPEAVNVAKLLTDNLPPALWRVIFTNVVYK